MLHSYRITSVLNFRYLAPGRLQAVTVQWSFVA